MGLEEIFKTGDHLSDKQSPDALKNIQLLLTHEKV